MLLICSSFFNMSGFHDFSKGARFMIAVKTVICIIIAAPWNCLTADPFNKIMKIWPFPQIFIAISTRRVLIQRSLTTRVTSIVFINSNSIRVNSFDRYSPRHSKGYFGVWQRFASYPNKDLKGKRKYNRFYHTCLYIILTNEKFIVYTANVCETQFQNNLSMYMLNNTNYESQILCFQ